ncbi:hypothetical protein EAI_00061, partial [Harpegnathos saltator]
KQRDVAKISAELKHDPVRMIMACRYAAKQSFSTDLYTVLDKIVESSDTQKKIRKLLNEPIISLTKKTAQEALAFLFDNLLSKTVYQNIRLETK